MNNFENCGYYIDDECTICGMGTDGEDTFCKYCKDNPNCYYKQLAELKAENERLKEENKLIRQLHKDLSDKLFEFQKIEDTLQEIKKIAERAFAVCDDDCGNANKFKEIIELTKAEEE